MDNPSRGRLTDSGDAKVGTAGNIGISESTSGNKNCASLLRFDFWVKRTAEVGKNVPNFF